MQARLSHFLEEPNGKGEDTGELKPLHALEALAAATERDQQVQADVWAEAAETCKP